MKKEDLVWVEKYRPRKISDCILPKDLKDTFEAFAKKDFIPNLLLTGTAGVGKTTVAKALCDQCGFDSKIINASMDGNIDTLRNDIKSFASTVSFNGKRKYVILDEADNLNAQSTQPALRAFIEKFSKNCGFIFTCNHKNKIIEPLHSRCSVVEFKVPKAEIPKLAMEFMTRVKFILAENNVKCSDAVLAEFIKKHFPDFRRILNELQRHSHSGEITSEVLLNLTDENFKKLVGFLKDKEFTKMRTWVANNSDLDSNTIYNMLYKSASENMGADNIPQLVLHIAKYSYQGAFATDPEINTVACLTEIMMDCSFK